jgi:hypothetical protein
MKKGVTVASQVIEALASSRKKVNWRKMMYAFYPSRDSLGVPMLDVNNPNFVEIKISEDGTTLWVNVDHQCMFRLSHSYMLVVNDQRKKSEKDFSK